MWALGIRLMVQAINRCVTEYMTYFAYLYLCHHFAAPFSANFSDAKFIVMQFKDIL